MHPVLRRCAEVAGGVVIAALILLDQAFPEAIKSWSSQLLGSWSHGLKAWMILLIGAVIWIGFELRAWRTRKRQEQGNLRRARRDLDNFYKG